jgi:arabinogalactan oligomer/maltooligosaccharide transport system substrate-binding protein
MSHKPSIIHFLVGLCAFYASFSLAAPKQKITIWEHEREEIVVMLDELIKKYSKLHPDIEIKRAHYKTEELRTQFQTAALGGGGPDIIIAPNDFAGPLSLMGLIKPVNDQVKVDEHFVEVIDAVRGEDGKIWGYPMSRGNHLMLFVNKKMIKSAPETIEAMVAEAKKITNASKKVYGLAYNLNEPFWFASFMAAHGEKPLIKSQPNLMASGVINALTMVHDWKYKDKIVPADCDYTCADTLFVEGANEKSKEAKAAMTINGDWAISKYEEAHKSNLMIAPLPKSEKTGQYMQPMISGKYVFVSRNVKPKQLEAVSKFAAYLASAEAQEYAAKVADRLPSLKSVAASDVVTKDPILMASQNALSHGQPMPMDVGLRAVWDAMRPQLQNVMAGRTQPTIAAKNMQKDAETKIKEMRQ